MVSEIVSQVNEVVEKILLRVTNQNDDSEETEELEQEEDDCNAAFKDKDEPDVEGEQDQWLASAYDPDTYFTEIDQNVPSFEILPWVCRKCNHRYH